MLQVVFLGDVPGVPKMSLALEQTPDLHRCNLGVALEQETFLGLPGHPPKRLLAPSPTDLGAIREFGGCTRQSGSQSWAEGSCMMFPAFPRDRRPKSCRGRKLEAPQNHLQNDNSHLSPWQPQALDIFENPLRAPRPHRAPKTRSATKKENSKNPKIFENPPR